MKILGEVSAIFIYPVKSLPPMVVQSCHMTRCGAAHPENVKVVDRKWMIISSEGGFLSQRNTPRLALIKQDYKDGRIFLSTSTMNRHVSFSVEVPDKKVDCRLWGNPLTLYSYGGEVAEWLSEFLGISGLDLVNFGDKIMERNRPEFDYNRFMLLSEASLADLNSRLENKVTIRNFRANLVAKNAYGPFDEDKWEDFKIGDCKLKKVAFCIRCVMTTVDPDQGVKHPKMQPLKTLKEFRMRLDVDKVGPLFGVYLDLASPVESIVKVGDLIVEDQTF